MTLRTHSPRSVFAPVTALFFQAHQEDECRTFLAKRSSSTECVPVVEASQLVMRSDGRLAESNYRYNALGFEAVTRAMANGLSGLFNELSGEVSRRLPNPDTITQDVAAAVSIYNTVLNIRFDRLRERTLLVNHQEKAVEGFLGLDHRMLDNTEFFNIVSAAINEQQKNAAFYRAELTGRELRLYFIDNDSRREDIHPDPQHTFAAGWYFSNREDVGQAIKGATCLYTKFGVALSPSHAKIVHTGADLVGRMSLLATTVARKNIDMPIVATQLKKLLSTSLQFSDKKSDFDRAVRHWSNYLVKLKIKMDTATAISKNAAATGSDIRPRDALEAYTRSAMASRTAYDLVCSVLRWSKNEYGTYKDVLQGAAMKMLMPEKEEGKLLR